MTTVTMCHHTYGEKEVDTHEKRLRHSKRRLDAWSKAVWQLGKVRPLRVVGVRLSYRPGVEWFPGHISDCMNRFVKWAGERLLAYAWAAELQERGAVHYHICIVLPAGTWIPFFDEVYPEQGIRLPLWPHGSCNFKELRTPSAKYLTSYLEKSEQKRDEFPKGLRIMAVVIRKHVQPDIPSAALFWYRLSAAVGALRKFILTKLQELAFWLMGDAKYEGWRWEYLGGGDWLPWYRDVHFMPVHSEWWCQEYPPRKRRKRVGKVTLLKPKMRPVQGVLFDTPISA